VERETTERSFEATLDTLPSVLDFVTTAARSGNLAAEQMQRLELAVEEAVANVCNHAYVGRQGRVRVRVRSAERGVTVEIEDDGRRFDPTARPAPDLSADLDRRHAGGLGIELLRRMVDRVSYRRRGDRNVLSLVMSGPRRSPTR
jgi:anti-sigma regulatory factor (Ser/Thr protein kinase)